MKPLHFIVGITIGNKGLHRYIASIIGLDAAGATMNVELSAELKSDESTTVRHCEIRHTGSPCEVIGLQNGNKRVHFALNEACYEFRTLSGHLSEDESLDSIEKTRRRSQIWYSEEDYEDFKSDRMATIRMFRSLQGDMDEVLEDFYCLRGLEPFHSPSLHSELCVHRAIYVNVVLSEQRRAILQKIRKEILSGGKDNGEEGDLCLAEAIRHRIEHVSKWSMQRAQRLAVLDEIEAQKSMEIRIIGGDQVGHSPFLLQDGSNRSKSLAVSSQVNLLELKEMNRRLCEEMGVPSPSSLQQSPASKSSTTETDMMSLNALMQASIIKSKSDKIFPPLPIDYRQQDLSILGNVEVKL